MGGKRCGWAWWCVSSSPVSHAPPSYTIVASRCPLSEGDPGVDVACADYSFSTGHTRELGCHVGGNSLALVC